MPVTAVVGLQWGDEGKGKVAHLLSQGADLVVRSQGGANAGHTVKTGGKTYKWSVLPAGGMSANAVALGSSVVLDLGVLSGELDALRDCNPQARVYISCQSHIVLDVHKEMDSWEEGLRGDQPIGTTKMGIGPTYEDKVARRGLRVADALDESTMRRRIEGLVQVKRKLGLKSVDVDDTMRSVSTGIEKIRGYVCHVPRIVQEAVSKGSRVILEGAHGTLLDLDFGTYPYVTSSNTVASALCTGAGLGPRSVDEVVGIAKAYTTRVGAGPLPTEVEVDTAAGLREKAKEYGTRTGRPRRIGWLDLPATKYAADLNGASSIVLTKIDILGGMDRIKVCVGYEANGEEIDCFPQTSEQFQMCRPVYEEMKGWPDLSPEGWQRVASYGKGQLPGEILEYVGFVERYLGTKVSMISVGSDLQETLVL